MDSDDSCIQPSKTSEAVLLQVSRFQFRWLQELLTFGSAREHRTEEWASRLGKPKIKDSEHDFASINIRTASDSEAEVFTVGVSVGFGVFLCRCGRPGIQPFKTHTPSINLIKPYKDMIPPSAPQPSKRS